MNKKNVLLLAATGAVAAGLTFLGYVKREKVKGYVASVSKRLRPKSEVDN